MACARAHFGFVSACNVLGSLTGKHTANTSVICAYMHTHFVAISPLQVAMFKADPVNKPQTNAARNFLQVLLKKGGLSYLSMYAWGEAFRVISGKSCVFPCFPHAKHQSSFFTFTLLLSSHGPFYLPQHHPTLKLYRKSGSATHITSCT
jgi:hypothetical protein